MKRSLVASAILLAGLAAGCSDSNNSAAPVVNQPPTISSIMDATVPANSSAEPISFSIDDALTAAGSLTVSVSSDNETLFAGGELVVDGSGADRTLLVTPTPASLGSAIITLTVTDAEGLEAQTTFMLTVVPQQVSFDATLRTIFSGGENGDPETLNDKELTDDASDFNDLLGA